MTRERPWPTVIAVDFDGTLCASKWPEIGEPHWPIIRELIRRQREGARIVLWTCRSGELLDNAVSWCLDHGIQFDAINSNVAERIEQYGDDSRKVSADEYWDDRNVLVSGGLSPLLVEADGCLMRALEATAATNAGQRESGRLRNWLKTWTKGFRRGRHETG